MSKSAFLDYNLSIGGIRADARDAMGWINAGQKNNIVATINAHSASVAEDDIKFKQALQQANLLIPDGISVVLAARFLGCKITERVSGHDFFQSFSELANQRGGISYFFLGSSDAVLGKISKRLAQDYPNIRLAGILSPPFKATFSNEDNIEICNKINATKPDVVWVGMTAPKQEKWMEENRMHLDIGFAGAIGAVFDFYAGTKPRAPIWLQKLGFEWLHRLVQEPRRVWRRYLINSPRFILLVLKYKFCRS